MHACVELRTIATAVVASPPLPLLLLLFCNDNCRPASPLRVKQPC